MNENSIRKKVFSGLFWKFGERICAQGVSFSVSIILARLLSPNDYGVVAIVLIFINLADVFVNSGFNTALIQKKDADEIDYSTVFYFSFTISWFIYLIMFILAPYIANFYKMSSLTLIIRVFSIRVPLSIYNSIQHSYVSRNMLFKNFFFSTIIGTLISGIVGIIMAYLGCGVWALIGQYFTNTIIDTIVLSITVPWHLKLLFSWNRAKVLFDYGWKVCVSDFLGTLFDNLRSLIIGRVYTTSDLAYYNRGKSFSGLISTNVTSTVMTVLFPAFSDYSDNLNKVKAMTRKAFRMMAYIILPLLGGLAAISDNLILVLLTSKWSQSIIFLKILCISAAVEMIGQVSLQSIKAIGKSEVILKLEIVKKPIYFLFLIIGVKISVVAIAATMAIYSLIATIINASQLSKYIEYSVSQQLRDLFKPVILTIIMMFVVYMIGYINANSLVILILQIISGGIVYLSFSKIIKAEEFSYLKNTVKQYWRK